MSENFYKEAWNYSMDELHKQYKEQNKEDEFILWPNKMTYVEDTIDSITASVPTNFIKNMITTKGYSKVVEDKLKEITGQDNIKINIIIVAENKTERKPKIEKSEIVEKPIKENIEEPKTITNVKKKHPLLKEEFNFDTFIPGENSNFAYSMALAVAQNPGQKYNPLLLYGGSGLGKTHLMQSIGNYIYNNNPEKLKICYVSAENFGNEFTSSLSSKKINDFKNKYRNLDVLLLDDIHFLQGKNGMQEELFYTFEALYQKNAQMVFTCDRPIREIKNMTERLVSRLSNGICIDLKPPNYETRIAIIKKKLELQDKVFDQDIIEYIAKNVEKNVRELEAALNTIIGYSDLVGKEPTIEIVKSQLKNILTTSSAENISLKTIQTVIANEYNITVADLKSKKKDKKFALPRQIAMYIAKEITESSYTDIGNQFGGKDHSTVMHAYHKIEDLIKTDPSLEERIDIYIREIKEYKSE